MQNFNAQVWLQGQVGQLIQHSLTSASEAREAVEQLAGDDAFWSAVGPMMRAAEAATPGLVLEVQQTIAAAAARGKPGVS